MTRLQYKGKGDEDDSLGYDFGAANFIKVNAYFPTTTHFVKREYLLYTYDNFVADVGGYLGLLLGHRQAN